MNFKKTALSTLLGASCTLMSINTMAAAVKLTVAGSVGSAGETSGATALSGAFYTPCLSPNPNLGYYTQAKTNQKGILDTANAMLTALNTALTDIDAEILLADPLALSAPSATVDPAAVTRINTINANITASGVITPPQITTPTTNVTWAANLHQARSDLNTVINATSIVPANALTPTAQTLPKKESFTITYADNTGTSTAATFDFDGITQVTNATTPGLTIGAAITGVQIATDIETAYKAAIADPAQTTNWVVSRAGATLTFTNITPKNWNDVTLSGNGTATDNITYAVTGGATGATLAPTITQGVDAAHRSIANPSEGVALWVQQEQAAYDAAVLAESGLLAGTTVNGQPFASTKDSLQIGLDVTNDIDANGNNLYDLYFLMVNLAAPGYEVNTNATTDISEAQIYNFTHGTAVAASNITTGVSVAPLVINPYFDAADADNNTTTVINTAPYMTKASFDLNGSNFVSTNLEGGIQLDNKSFALPQGTWLAIAILAEPSTGTKPLKLLDPSTWVAWDLQPIVLGTPFRTGKHNSVSPLTIDASGAPAVAAPTDGSKYQQCFE